MSERVMTAEQVSDYIITTFHTNQIRVKKSDTGITIEPAEIISPRLLESIEQLKRGEGKRYNDVSEVLSERA